MDKVVGDLVRTVEDGGDLLENDVALALQLLADVGRVENDVGQDVERDPLIALEHTCKVSGVLQAGGGIELSADGLDLLRDGARAAPGRALEGHVLQEMR